MVQEVSYRLGYKRSLKHNAIMLIWNMCRYELAWHTDKLSAWCAVRFVCNIVLKYFADLKKLQAFTPSNIKILEYSEDIQFYYRKSHGSPMNLRLGCSTFVDMTKRLDENHSPPKVILYFTHSTLIYLMLTLFGTINDSSALRADNYKKMEHRKFQSSKICPFGSNIAAVKYVCSDLSEKVLFMHNQKRLNISWCDDGVCDWNDFKSRYFEYVYGDCETIFCSRANDINFRFRFVFVFSLLLSIRQCL